MRKYANLGIAGLLVLGGVIVTTQSPNRQIQMPGAALVLLTAALKEAAREGD